MREIHRKKSGIEVVQRFRKKVYLISHDNPTLSVGGFV